VKNKKLIDAKRFSNNKVVECSIKCFDLTNKKYITSLPFELESFVYQSLKSENLSLHLEPSGELYLRTRKSKLKVPIEIIRIDDLMNFPENNVCVLQKELVKFKGFDEFVDSFES